MPVGIPFFQQYHPDACGAACVQMVLASFGKCVLQPVVFGKHKAPDPNNFGKLGMSMTSVKAEIESHGLNATFWGIDCSDVRRMHNAVGYIVEEKGAPLIVAQLFGPSNMNRVHFRVITGVEQTGFRLHDPFDANGKHALMPLDEALRLWNVPPELGSPGCSIIVHKDPIPELKPEPRQ